MLGTMKNKIHTEKTKQSVKAARKRLGKASFSKEDIKGMKTSIQMIRP